MTDGKLTLLRMKRHRLKRKHQPIIDWLEDTLREKKYELRILLEKIDSEEFAYKEHIGLCGYCDKPKDECEGHIMLAIEALDVEGK